MSPTERNPENDRECFPRVSGDEPGLRKFTVAEYVFSPREWG